MSETRKLTNSQFKVLRVLERNAGCWVSGYTLNRVAFAYSQRCGELRRLHGFDIDSRRIKGGRVNEYRLNQRQRELFNQERSSCLQT